MQQRHLNEEQIAELVAASPRELTRNPALSALHAHAFKCAECAAEVDSIRESIALFREASSAFAQSNFDNLPALRPPARVSMLQHQPLWWAAAAAAVLLTAFLPSHLRLGEAAKTAAPPPPAVVAHVSASRSESDEALLEDVNRRVSESIPSAMAALADPTSNSLNASPNATQRTN
jgi:anti-sigma factor RsiW